MSNQILCLSGWGQKFDSLEFIFKESSFDPFFISSLDYSSFDDVEKFLSFVKSQNLNSDILVGWSLGGQLAIRLITAKILKPKLLVLIAPPFQMIKDANVYVAMSQKTFKEFRSNFINSPNKTLKQFSILTAMNDRNATEIAKTLDIKEENFENLVYWLDELKRFSCFDIDFSNMPRTLFFQGAGDMIVHESQAKYFERKIKNFRLEIFKNCGHAPQLNNVERVRKTILEEIKNINLL